MEVRFVEYQNRRPHLRYGARMVEETVAATGFTLSSVLALLGAAFVLLGSAGAFYFGRIRDHYTDERISENVRKTAEAEAAGALGDLFARADAAE